MKKWSSILQTLGWSVALLVLTPRMASAQAEVFTGITDRFVELLTGPLARGLGLIAMAGCILLALFGEGGRFFKSALVVVFCIGALVNLVGMYDAFIGA
jgi:type IV secretory pathway VirB2 component (pilin)